MAHFAQINENNEVINVLCTSDEMPNEGYDWLIQNFGGKWIKTSYNTYANQHLLGKEPLRKNFATVGGTYDPVRDAFLYPKEFDSWILNEETFQWEPPIPRPEDGLMYQWDESVADWEVMATDSE
jgi:hypothetical protein